MPVGEEKLETNRPTRSSSHPWRSPGCHDTTRRPLPSFRADEARGRENSINRPLEEEHRWHAAFIPGCLAGRNVAPAVAAAG